MFGATLRRKFHKNAPNLETVPITTPKPRSDISPRILSKLFLSRCRGGLGKSGSVILLGLVNPEY